MRTLMDIQKIVAAVVVIVASLVSIVAADPGSGPVKVEFKQPAPMRTGEEATTVLTFRALADLDRLEVNVAPFKGVELLSEPTKVTFTGVKKGAGPQLTVRVRLTDEKFGYLGVTFQTRQGDEAAGGATTVVYPNVDGSPLQ